jgi:hypothetical protein
MLEILALALAVVGFLGCFDRLRCISWGTTHARVVVLHLVGAGGSLAVLWVAFTTLIEWWHLLCIAVILGALLGTRHRWRHGPPADVTKPAPLGEPELTRDSTWQ